MGDLDGLPGSDWIIIIIIIIDERIVGQPLDGPALCTDIPECVPHWQQARILIMQLFSDAL